MVSDPPNRHYGAILPALLQTQPLPIASATFQGLYGAAFAAVLDTPELNLLQVTPTEQNKDPGPLAKPNVKGRSSRRRAAKPAAPGQEILFIAARLKGRQSRRTASGPSRGVISPAGKPSSRRQAGKKLADDHRYLFSRLCA